EEAGVKPGDIKYVSIYDSFTITVLICLEDLGFCPRGGGGRFVSDGNLISGTGKLPFNTDGGGLCNNHPANRGGEAKVVGGGGGRGGREAGRHQVRVDLRQLHDHGADLPRGSRLLPARRRRTLRL